MKTQLPDCMVLRRSWPEYWDPSTNRVVRVGDVEIGGATPTVIAGPCAVESFDQTLENARACKAAGADLLRGGAYKPRTHPGSFQGLGLEGLEILAEVRRQTGLGIVTEVMDLRLVDQVAEYADMLQIGSRSMQNYPLLEEVGRQDRPVLLKRGWSATLEEWLCAAEYIARGGNTQIVLCERGIRTSCHWAYSRNVLDLGVIEPLREACPLPILVDPSHGTGSAENVAAMSRAALACGAHGLLIEVVADESLREKALCDGDQSITPDVLAEIVEAAHGARVPFEARDRTRA